MNETVAKLPRYWQDNGFDVISMEMHASICCATSRASYISAWARPRVGPRPAL